MNVEAADQPLASFEAKWSEAYPEFGLALRFDRGAEREAHAAFACLVFEIEHAAFGIREAQPAAIKLQWWAEELLRAGQGAARHPLTQTLGARLSRENVAPELWHATIVGALAQRDPEPATDGATLLDQYAQLYQPLAKAESTVFATHAESVMGVLTLRRALRETAALPIALRDGKLPLPLDLLARHRLSRGDLANPSPERVSALHDWCHGLEAELLVLAIGQKITVPERGVFWDRSLGILRTVMAAVDAKRAGRAIASKSDPLTSLNDAFAKVSLRDAWFVWRTLRRSRT